MTWLAICAAAGHRSRIEGYYRRVKVLWAPRRAKIFHGYPYAVGNHEATPQIRHISDIR